MKILQYFLILGLFAALVGRVQAAIITVGDHDIAPDAITEIQILIERELTDPDLFGVSLALQITEGTVLSGPAIESVDMISGTIFAANNNGGQDVGSNLDPPQHAFWEVQVDNNLLVPLTIPANGLLATVRVNAIGLTERQTYNLTASSFLANGVTTQSLLIDNNADPVVPMVNDGTITVTPEPFALTLWAVSSLLTVRLRWRRRLYSAE